jgi:hypothetical protein
MKIGNGVKLPLQKNSMADPYLWLILASGTSKRQYTGYWRFIMQQIPVHY